MPRVSRNLCIINSCIYSFIDVQNIINDCNIINDFNWNVCGKNSEFYNNAFKTVDAPFSLSHVVPILYDILCVRQMMIFWWWQTDEFWSHTSMFIYLSWLLRDHFSKPKISPWSRGIIPTHIFNAERVLQSSEQNGVQTSQICL